MFLIGTVENMAVNNEVDGRPDTKYCSAYQEASTRISDTFNEDVSKSQNQCGTLPLSRNNSNFASTSYAVQRKSSQL